MPDLAKKVTKEQIENAIDYILNKEIELNKSTSYNFVFKIGIPIPYVEY